MISSRASFLSGRCPRCFHTIIDAFSVFAGISKPSIAIRPPRRLCIGSGIPRRSFATTSVYPSDVVRQAEYHALGNEHFKVPEGQENAESEAPGSSTDIPWYLQIKTPQRVTSPLSERQRLPDLPPDPPPLLQPMLEHISIQLGLDDLSLLDLRKLDPPPALGSNLLMVLGTARSEKHLHVSADRFCRWLRTEHKLSPFADGLLGRGELKLKLRRKARRAKVLSRVGSTEMGSADDGIRTGWICVNVGTVEDGGTAPHTDFSMEGYVGFGAATEGVKIVVQMLTGEKREDLDLERLWKQALARQERRRDRILQGEKEAVETINAEVGVVPMAWNTVSDQLSFPSSSHSQSLSSCMPRIRAFHNGTRFFSTKQANQVAARDYDLDAADLEPRILTPSEQDLNSSSEPLSSDLSGEVRQSPEDFNDAKRLLSLQSKLRYLKSLRRKDAIEVLGRGVNDVDSTSFLKSFYDEFPLFPNTQLWEYRLSLICHAIEIGHPSYTKSNLVSSFEELQASALDIPPSLFTIVVCTLFQESHKHASGADRPEVSVKDILAAAEILEDMALRGENIMTEEIMTSLQVALIFRFESDRENDVWLHTDAEQRLRLLMAEHDFPNRSNESYSRVLNACASVGKWDSFWDVWDSVPRNFQPRGPELYALMFRHTARRNHQAEAMKALRHNVPLMGREEPPVKLSGEVAKAVILCLRVADPAVDEDVRGERNERGEWVRLYRRCQKGLRQGAGGFFSETP